MNVKKPTIVFLSTETQPGGTATSTKIIVDNIDRKKFKVIGISISNSETAKKILERAMEYKTIGLSPFPQIRQWRKNEIQAKYSNSVKLVLWFLRAIHHFRRILKEHPVDVVHSNSLHANIISGFSTIGLKTYSVWHIRSPQKQPLIRGGSLLVEGLLSSWLADRFIANSNFTYNSFHKSWQKKAILIPNAIDTEWIAGNQKRGALKKHIGLEKDTRIVGLVGIISHRKGMDRFVEMAGRVSKRRPETHFVIIGGAHNAISEKYRANLQKKIRSCQLEEKIHLIGDLEMAPLFASDMDVFFMSSRPGTETFGLVVIEAMAAGVPVVAFNNDAMPEIIKEGKTGFIVPEGDIQAAADKVLQILNNEGLASKIRNEAFKDVASRFDKSRLIRQIESLYDTILTGR